ncbi:phosphatase PAP2 family protein [Streptomyces sp. NBC_01465]|uniref:phosphatase PAP2 family protein n=1 Tax=Streptomyces sp. NBC_01465 TaxID=2903878 RepID=UPI002E329142|nr:phosphatase PAP2 family protein [Streptomyces sp. NBC_01465]
MSAPAPARTSATAAAVAVALGCAALLALLTAVVVVRNGTPLPGDLAAHNWSLAHRPPVGLAVARAVTATGTGVLPYAMVLVAGLVAAAGRTAGALPAGGAEGEAMDGARRTDARDAATGLLPTERVAATRASGSDVDAHAPRRPVRRVSGLARGVSGAPVRSALAALAFLLLGQVLRYGLMEAVGRERPPLADWATHASGYSFPSGHAATSALVAGILGWALLRRVRRAALRRAVCVVLVCWALAVGLSRVYLGVHWAGDVVAGWLFAASFIAVAIACTPLLRTSIRLPEVAALRSR